MCDWGNLDGIEGGMKGFIFKGFKKANKNSLEEKNCLKLLKNLKF